MGANRGLLGQQEEGLALLRDLGQTTIGHQGVQLGRGPLAGLAEQLTDVGSGIPDTALHHGGDAVASFGGSNLFLGRLAERMGTLVELVGKGVQLLHHFGRSFGQVLNGETDGGQVGDVGSHNRQPLSRGRSRPKILFRWEGLSLTFYKYYTKFFPKGQVTNCYILRFPVRGLVPWNNYSIALLGQNTIGKIYK